MAPSRRQRIRHDFSDEAEILKRRRRGDADSHGVIQLRRAVLASNLCQSTVSREVDDQLSMVEVLAVVELDGVAVDGVVEYVYLQKADGNPLPRFLAPY